MKTHTLLALTCFSLLTPSLFGQTNTPPISEEARKHFLRGSTLAENPKTAADFAKVVSEFKQAVDLAPQLPQARYNLAKAREAAGDFSGAVADLKIYQRFKLSDSEARMVQDKIYTLEAKAGVVAEKQAGEQKAAVAEQQKKRDDQNKIGFLAGKWNVLDTTICSCPGNGIVRQDQAVITVTGKNILITRQKSHNRVIKGRIQGDDYTSIRWTLTGEHVPDLPLVVTIDKSAHQINWKEPSITIAGADAFVWDPSTLRDTRLTR